VLTAEQANGAFACFLVAATSLLRRGTPARAPAGNNAKNAMLARRTGPQSAFPDDEGSVRPATAKGR
jgi:hypothetical protein